MTDSETHSRPLVGKIVRSIRGRDAGKFAVVIEQLDDRFVLIADGDKRKLDRPKRKNVMHLEMTEHVAEEIVDAIENGGRLTNGKLRYHLNKFLEQLPAEVQRKGE